MLSAKTADAEGQGASHRLQIVFVKSGSIVEAIHEAVANSTSQAKPTENIYFEPRFRGNGEEGVFIIWFTVKINIHGAPAGFYAGKNVDCLVLWRYVADPEAAMPHLQLIEIFVQQAIIVSGSKAISAEEKITGHEGKPAAYGSRPVLIQVTVFNQWRDKEPTPVATVEKRFIPVVAPRLGEHLCGNKCE